MAQGDGGVQFVEAERRGQARPRVDEVPGLAEIHRQVVLVIDPRHIQPDTPVLHVGIAGQPRVETVFGPGEHIGLLLDTGIEIPVVLPAADVQRSVVVPLAQRLVPEQFPIVVAVIPGHVDPSHEAEPVAAEGHLGIGDPVAIGHGFAENDITLGLGGYVPIPEIRRESVGAQFLAGLVTLIIAIAVRIVQGRRPRPTIAELMRPVELYMLLQVVVGMIPVIPLIPLGIIVNAFRVPGAVVFQVRQRDTSPGNARRLLAAQIRQAQGIPPFQPSGYGKDAGGIAPGIPDIPFRLIGRIGQAEIQAIG